MIDEAAVESALEILRPGLASDGFELRIGALQADNTVQVVLEAKPDACIDCLVPEDLMIAMISNAIRKNDPALDRVDLVKQGFDSVAPH